MFRGQVLKFRLGCVLSGVKMKGTHMRPGTHGTHTVRGEAAHRHSAMRDTCSVVWRAHSRFCFSPCQPGPLALSLQPICMDVRRCSLKNKGVWGGGLDGILVTWGELLSSLNPPPWTTFPPLPPMPTPRQNAVSGG